MISVLGRRKMIAAEQEHRCLFADICNLDSAPKNEHRGDGDRSIFDWRHRTGYVEVASRRLDVIIIYHCVAGSE